MRYIFNFSLICTVISQGRHGWQSIRLIQAQLVLSDSLHTNFHMLIGKMYSRSCRKCLSRRLLCHQRVNGPSLSYWWKKNTVAFSSVLTTDNWTVSQLPTPTQYQGWTMWWIDWAWLVHPGPSISALTGSSSRIQLTKHSLHHTVWTVPI